MRTIFLIFALSIIHSCKNDFESIIDINKYSKIQNFNHVSTGGGASMELLEGKKLPGVNIYEPLII